MKKAWKAVGLLALALLFGSSARDLHARITGNTGQRDIWAVGPSGAEVVVDSDGNLLPTTDNDTTLGTSSLRWATGYIMDITVGDDLTVADDATITDDLTVNGDTTLGDTNADSLTVNASTVNVLAQVNAVRISTGGVNPGGAQNILSVDGSNKRVGIGNDDSPDATLEIVPQSNQLYSLKVSSFNASTDILAVNSETSQVETGTPSKFFSRTSAQLAALAPVEANLFVINSTYGAVCVSTGTTAGAWVITSSFTAVASGIRVPCY